MNTTPGDDASPAHLRSFDQVAREDLRRFDLGIGAWNARSRVAIESRMSSYRCESVLDLGCGPGTFAQTLRNFGSRALYVGVDSSPALLALAVERHVDPWRESRIGRQEPTRRFERADLVEPLPFGEQFDAVVVRHVLEHVVPGWGKVLENALRAARKVVFVVLSQPMNRRDEAIPTDEYLGLRRWSLPSRAFEAIVAANRFHVDQTVTSDRSTSRPEVERSEVLLVLRPLSPITSAPMNDNAAERHPPRGHFGIVPHQPSPELAEAIRSGRVAPSSPMSEKILSMSPSEPPPEPPTHVASD